MPNFRSVAPRFPYLVARPSPKLAIPPGTLLSAFPSQRRNPLLLRMCIDVSPNNEGNEIKERHPSLRGEELLRKGKRNGRGYPGDFHDGHEAGADGGADLVDGAGAGYEGHGG